MSHLVFRVSSCGFSVLFLVGFVLLFFGKTPGFLLSPILQYVGIANQRQNVLMTVRASSVHGMSSKKKIVSPPITFRADLAIVERHLIFGKMKNF